MELAGPAEWNIGCIRLLYLRLVSDGTGNRLTTKNQGHRSSAYGKNIPDAFTLIPFNDPKDEIEIVHPDK